MQAGTVVLFDDWNCYGASPLHGERAAAREVFSAPDDLQFEPYALYGWHGAMFIATPRVPEVAVASPSHLARIAKLFAKA